MTFPVGPVRPGGGVQSGGAFSPRPMTPPQIPTVDPRSTKVVDATQCVDFSGYVVQLPPNLE